MATSLLSRDLPIQLGLDRMQASLRLRKAAEAEQQRRFQAMESKLGRPLTDAERFQRVLMLDRERKAQSLPQPTRAAVNG